MQVLVLLATLAIVYFYGHYIHGLIAEGNYVLLVLLFIAPFIWARYVSTDWEKEQDAANFRAWKQKWRYRLSWIWPMRGDVLPPSHEKISKKDQGEVRKFPKSS